MVDSKYLWEVINMQIKEGLKRNYSTTTTEEHLKMERLYKEKLLDRLSQFSDEVFTLNH
jgi:hypothetical protein